MTDDRYTGYATENVTELEPEDVATLTTLYHALIPHSEYGTPGCALCRHLEAHRVSKRFPETPFRAVVETHGRVNL